MTRVKIGIDAGGTLIKIAYIEDEKVNYQTFNSRETDEASKWIKEKFNNPSICITGGRSEQLAGLLDAQPQTVVEFDATASGIKYLAEKQGYQLGQNYLFVNVGTGTSIHSVKESQQERVGGSGIGGGTLLGLAYLLTGKLDYEEIIRSASEGDRGNVDLKVKDIFEGSLPPISGDLTASNFGKKNAMASKAPSDADKVAAVVGLIGEVIVTISTQMAFINDTSSIVYVGSSFRSNPLLKEIIKEYTKMVGKEPVFLKNGEFSGAVGALLTLDA
ncbi:type II pantothenate kinase [Virgibacillus kekensis]|uniref:Type II pantothenate kinase n=1 Tax=Virgibacillus kekensis TaxID=202261 RepID=A0ABV9DHH2_9BACI